MSDELERAVAAYREQLRAEADLARRDLDEIEDHLRALIGELRDGGMPLADATREAATRLGDPRAVAREHARVSTSFGAKMPAWRAWIAAAAVIVQLFAVLRGQAVFVMPPLQIFELALGLGFAVGLALGVTWMRPILLAAALWQIAWGLCFASPMMALAPGVWPASVVAAVMLLPWSRRELRAPGVALGLLYFAFLGAMWLVNMQFTNHAGNVIDPTGDDVALVCVFLAAAGIVLRARWAAVAAMIAALFQAVGAVQLATFGQRHGPNFHLLSILIILGGAVCAAIAAVVAWRTARSGLGTFRDVLA